MTSPYATIGARLIDNGYSAIPIMPGTKRPDLYTPQGWYGTSEWQKYCDRLPTEYEFPLWDKWKDAGVCVAIDHVLKVIDIDTDDSGLMAAVLSVLPDSPVKKRGNKGFSAFYRGSRAIVSAPFSIPIPGSTKTTRVVDLLGHGRQTVLPPTIHPDTGRPYEWLSSETLVDTSVSQLPELPDDVADKLAEVLKPWGYEPTAEHRAIVHGDGDSMWREVNELALVNLDSWVPALALPDTKRSGSRGYRAVASWRGVENANLSFHAEGIKDWGDDKSYTALDVVMLARSADLNTATKWLAERLNYNQAQDGFDVAGFIARSHAPKAPCAANDNRVIVATPYVWRDPSTIPRRAFLYGQHFIRKFMTATLGAGGSGKSLEEIAEILAMISGEDLLRDGPCEPLRVWYVNLEDPNEETERRFAAAALHHKIEPTVLEKRLFTDSGRDQEFVVVKEEGRQTRIVEPVVRGIIDAIARNKIDVLIIDPFVSTHEVDENDNSKIQRVAAQWVRIADEANAAVELVHHVRKVGDKKQITADDGRGAGALKDKARSVRVINGMTKKEAASAGIEEKDRLSFFRIDKGKANLTQRTNQSAWRKMVSMTLGNGATFYDPPDWVGVVTPWKWSAATTLEEEASEESLQAIQAKIAAGSFKAHHMAKDWAGLVVADVLSLDPEDRTQKKRIRATLNAWIEAGHFKIVSRYDPKRREEKDFIEVGIAQVPSLVSDGAGGACALVYCGPPNYLPPFREVVGGAVHEEAMDRPKMHPPVRRQQA